MTPDEWIARMEKHSRAAPAMAHAATQVTGQGYAGMAARDAPYDTGHLAGSINSQDTTTDPMRPEATAGTNVEYAAVHEHGYAGVDAAGRARNVEAVGYFARNLRAGFRLLAAELRKRMWR
ncbi:MAG: HK97 gp10 family phage protein [Actinomycetota bacterium]